MIFHPCFLPYHHLQSFFLPSVPPFHPQIAKWLGAPVLLVVDCWAIARSVGAVVLGYRDFEPGLNLGGVLFNKVGGEAHTKWLVDALRSGGLDVQVLGGIPKVRCCT
jgi:cobyrinic acid a,c-diamide synthase